MKINTIGGTFLLLSCSMSTTTAFTVVGTGSKAAVGKPALLSSSSSILLSNSDCNNNNNNNHNKKSTELRMSKTTAAEEKEQDVDVEEQEEEQKVVAGFTGEEMTIIKDVYEDDKNGLEERVLKVLPTWNPRLSFKIKNFNSIVALGGIDTDADNKEEELAIQMIVNVSKAVNTALDNRLNESKDLLQELLQAGEIRKLDSIIGASAREGKLDVAFFNVLTMNIQDAAANEQQQPAPPSVVLGGAPKKEGDDDNDDENNSESTGASRVQILQHIYTRCQEEVEKTIPPGTALLNKLLRTDNRDIRYNQLEHYLCPSKNVIKTPDGKELILNNPDKPNILVPPILLVEALANAVKQIRNVEAAGGTDRASAASMVESCRSVAKEARLVVGNKYGTTSEELKSFEQGLQPVFRPPSADSVYIKGE